MHIHVVKKAFRTTVPGPFNDYGWGTPFTTLTILWILYTSHMVTKAENLAPVYQHKTNTEGNGLTLNILSEVEVYSSDCSSCVKGR